jgi:hypothetical protein
MANTINSALIVDTVSEYGLTKLANRLASLSHFTTDFSADVKRPADVVQVSLSTAGSTTVTNPTDFSTIGASTLGASAVTLDHLYQPFGLSYGDIQNGIKLERIVQINMDKLADAIWAAATAPITVANFGAATVTGADSTVTPGSANLRALWAGVSKAGRKTLKHDVFGDRHDTPRLALSALSCRSSPACAPARRSGPGTWPGRGPRASCSRELASAARKQAATAITRATHVIRYSQNLSVRAGPVGKWASSSPMLEVSRPWRRIWSSWVLP